LQAVQDGGSARQIVQHGRPSRRFGVSYLDSRQPGTGRDEAGQSCKRGWEGLFVRSSDSSGSACSPKLVIERRTCSPHHAEV
jgi:hypothetical protein